MKYVGDPQDHFHIWRFAGVTQNVQHRVVHMAKIYYSVKTHNGITKGNKESREIHARAFYAYSHPLSHMFFHLAIIT